MAPQALHLYLGEPYNSKAAIWHEGTTNLRITPWTASNQDQITFIFILILFIDSVNRVYRVQIELSGSDEPGARGR